MVCNLCGREKEKLVTHHLSYKGEIVVEICGQCHLALHGLMRLSEGQRIKAIG
jgi:hypothetical protein